MLSRAERRQLTVMFCDLVGSTELSSRIDPEELNELLGRYRALVEAEVEKQGGTTARFFGDGVLIYFGYPSAREDDAKRAVRAAHNILLGMSAMVERPGLEPSPTLQVHIGIHTGMVLIDRTPGSGPGEIIGETPNLASKVEGLAPADTVLVSAATHALTAELFEYVAWGPLELRGFNRPVELFRLIGPRDWRREDNAGSRQTQLFDRVEETKRIARLWREVEGKGSGRIATIMGDPGIGKTRLTQWAAEHAQGAGHAVVTIHCAGDAVDTAFWPVADAIDRVCHLAGQPRPEQLRRLRRAALQGGLPPDPFAAAIADLLWPSATPDPAAGLPASAEGRRQYLVELLLGWIASLARDTPLLLIVENLHWADPSSRALLAELARRVPTLRMLLLVTARSGPEAPLAEITGAERIVLDRLPTTDLEEMLTALWREAILPNDMRRQLLEKCDGVPLFLEQLVKTVAERANRGGLAGLPDVPTSLRDMLAARLDRLGPAKPIALAASVIGRHFTPGLVRALLPRRAHEIEGGLALLVAADIIQPAGGTSAEPSFKFRHALLRDAAYDSLLRSDRTKHHRTLARAYRKHYASLAEAQPELVARHLSLAGEHADALDHWWKAGLRARARSSNREATAHFRAGIADAERLAGAEQSKAQVIRFTMAAGRAALAAEGFASPEVEHLNNRALALVEASASTHLLPAALGAVFSYYQVRGPLGRASDLASRLLEADPGHDDLELLARNKRRVGWCAFCRGDMREGRKWLAEALAHAQDQSLPREAGLAESDVKVIGLANLGWAESFGGSLKSGREHCEEALVLARRRYAEIGRHAHDVGNLPGDLAYALCMSAAVAKQTEDADQVNNFAGEARDFATAHDLPYWRAWSTVLLGWGRAHSDSKAGNALMLEGIADYEATGARLFVPYNLALLAEAYMASRRVTEGLELVERALAMSQEIEAVFMDSELLRIKARLVAQTGETATALDILTEAKDLAARHGAETIQRWAVRDHVLLAEGRQTPAEVLASVRRRAT